MAQDDDETPADKKAAAKEKKEKKKKEEKPPHPHAGNSQKLREGFVKEVAAVLKDMEPLQERKKDLMQAAKDNGLDTKALALAAKYYNADSEKRRKTQETLQEAEVMLSCVQLTLFPGG